MKKLFVIAALAALPCAAFAHGGATGIVKERMDAMKTLGAQMKVLGPMAQGNGYDEDAAAMAAKTMHDVANSLSHMFPEGSMSEVSEASAAIWEKPDAFAAEIELFIDSTKALQGADEFDLMEAFGAVGQSCKSCHTAFRVKK